MERNGYPEETYYTLSYSPVPADDGGIGGIVCANTDDTQRIIGERQVALLRELASRTGEARTIAEACELAATALQTDPSDLPFALLFLSDADRKDVSLAACSGIERELELRNPEAWPLRAVLDAGEAKLVEDLDARFTVIPAGGWDRPPCRAVLLPLPAQGRTGQAGVLVAGLNPYRLYDDGYQGFLGLVAGQIAAAVSEVVRDTDLLYRRPDGSLHWIRVTAIPIRDLNGTVTSAIVVFADVDQEVKSAQALRELNRTLESRVAAEIAERLRAQEALRQAQKMEAIGQLTGGVAHDFNNLLQVIVGNLESLRRPAAATGMVSESVVERLSGNALRGAERASQLTQRLLAFARRQPLQPRVLDVNAMVSGMSDLLHRTLGEAIRLEHALAPEPATVMADPSQLENALLNLAVNARDAMPEGGLLRIEVASVLADEIGESVMIAVSDTGTGMPPDVVEHVFEPFFTTKPAGQGTGLGLSQVYGFVRQSGGDVRIESEPGRGATVRLYLPAREGEAAEHTARGGLAFGGGRGETILAVELGYRVLEAPDGPAALEVLQSHPEVRLLFTDIGLPGGMNGRQLADSARVLRPGLRVVFTTGYAQEALTAQELADPSTTLLSKPFTYSALSRLIEEALGGAKAAAGIS